MSDPVDVLVIGGGSAALCAAIAARRNGASVRLVEHAPRALRGGNARHARNFRVMHELPTPYSRGVYGEEEFFRDLLRVTGGATDERLARTLIRGSATIAAWLQRNGVRLQDPAAGGLPSSRRTAFLLGGGKAMINALYATAARLGVAISYDSEVTELDFGDERSCKVVIRRSSHIERVAARTAVVCSGGHQANLDWLRKDLGTAADGLVVRGTRYATGSVLRGLLDAGVKPVGDSSRCHMVAVDARGPRFDGGIVTRIGAIPRGLAVDRNCTRLFDEGETGKAHYARWGARIALCPGQIAYLILDERGLARSLSHAWPPIQSPTIAALASKLQLDPDALENAVQGFNATIGSADDIPSAECCSSRPRPPPSREITPLAVPPFSAYPLRPGITFSHFGAAVDEHLRVVRQDGSPVTHVFAAGVVMAANVLGAGYLAGLGVTLSTVFGRVAGEAAARLAGDARSGPMLEKPDAPWRNPLEKGTPG